VRSVRLELLALLLGAAIALVGFVALRGASQRERGYLPRGSTALRREPSKRISRATTVSARRTVATVIRTSTSDLAVLASATIDGPSRAHSVVAAVATGPLATELDREFAVASDRIARRLRRSGAARLFAGWPLGFRVIHFARSHATVAIWHLDIGASSALGLMDTQYTTTTYALRWVGGRWRVAAASSIAGPTPPPATAPPAEVNEFAREVEGLTRYRYAP
jgi:hypothetical protein